MPSMIDLVPVAAALLPRAKRWCDPDVAARSELRVAGVAEARIAALYPFSLDVYLTRAAELLVEPERFAYLASIFTPASDNALASASGALHAEVLQKLEVSAYNQLHKSLPGKSPSSATRRTPPVVFRQWTLTLLYLNALAKQPSLHVPGWGILNSQMSALHTTVVGADTYFKQHPA